jgi:hypothetical protein
MSSTVATSPSGAPRQQVTEVAAQEAPIPMPTTGDAPATQYPRRLIALSPARRRFGSAVDVIGTMLRVGDPLADAAVADLAGHRVPQAAVTALLEGR